jgi:hypothetical protein
MGRYRGLGGPGWRGAQLARRREHHCLVGCLDLLHVSCPNCASQPINPRTSSSGTDAPLVTPTVVAHEPRGPMRAQPSTKYDASALGKPACRWCPADAALRPTPRPARTPPSPGRPTGIRAGLAPLVEQVLLDGS